MSFLQQALKEHSDRIELEKEKILNDFLQRFGYGDLIDDLKTNPNRRFKKLQREIYPDGTERFFVDDGSVDGKLILTFIPDKPIIEDYFSTDRKISMKIGFTFK